MSVCGADFCPGDSTEDNDNFDVDPTAVYTLAGVYLVFAVSSAAAVALLVDPLSR